MQTPRFNKTTNWGRLPAFLFCAAVLLSATSGLSRKPTIPRRHRAAARNCSIASIRPRSSRITRARSSISAARLCSRRASRTTRRVTTANIEQLESLDGKPRKMLRHNEDLYTFVPERHLCVVEKRQNKDSFPALLPRQR